MTMWTTNKVKYLARYINGYPFKPIDWKDNGVKIVRIQNLSDPDSIYNFTDANIDEIYKITKGDILISWSGTLGIFLWQDSDAFLNQHIFKVKTNNKIVDKDFYYYLATWFLQEMKKEIHGSTMQHITKDKFGSFKVKLPPLGDQKKIASILNKKKLQVEKLILVKEQLIKLLNEKKQITIKTYVLGKNVKNNQGKLSKLPWLKYIPSNWIEIKAKNVFYEIDERSKEGKEQLLSVSHYTGVTPRSEKKVNMIMAESYENYKLCNTDDLVINIMWAWMGALGISGYKGIVSNGYCVYRLKNKNQFNTKYLDYLLRTEEYIGEYTIRSKGVHSSRWRMYSEDFYTIPILCPPISEQNKIVDKINQDVSEINNALYKAGREIDLIKEYWNSYIEEVITGKIDVREEVNS